jgi:lipopolysaccharide export system permease protein
VRAAARQTTPVNGSSNFDGQEVNFTRRAQHPLRTAVGAEFLNLATTEPEDLSSRELRTVMDYQQSRGASSRPHEFAYWSRWARTLAIPLAVLLALPFLFGSLRASGSGARATLGLILGLSYFLLQRLTESGTFAFGLNATLLAWLPTLLLALAVSVLLMRLKAQRIA